MPRFARAFFERDTTTVARDLLGARLVRTLPGRGTVTARIVETESYPPGDAASHAFRGPTPRSTIMFGRPGHAYAYFIYGMYWCLNVVTEPAGVGSAVLIRGLDEIDGCDGPGKLCLRLNIDAALNGVDLLDAHAPLRLLRPTSLPREAIITTTRIGIRQAADRPLRFYLEGSPGVSRPR